MFKDDIRKFEDTKGVIRSRKAKKDRNIMAKRKRTNNDPQNTTKKTNVQVHVSIFQS